MTISHFINPTKYRGVTIVFICLQVKGEGTERNWSPDESFSLKDTRIQGHHLLKFPRDGERFPWSSEQSSNFPSMRADLQKSSCFSEEYQFLHSTEMEKSQSQGLIHPDRSIEPGIFCYTSLGEDCGEGTGE